LPTNIARYPEQWQGDALPFGKSPRECTWCKDTGASVTCRDFTSQAYLGTPSDPDRELVLDSLCHQLLRNRGYGNLDLHRLWFIRRYKQQGYKRRTK
jgi:hypothetical protein